MNLNANNIEKGMDVFGSDGDKIGSVADVHSTSGSGGTAGYGTSGSGQGMGNADVVVEEVDVVEVAPDYTASSGDMGTASAAGTGASSGSGTGGGVADSGMSGATGGGNTSGTTWNAGSGSSGDIGATGTANDQNTSPGYMPGGSTSDAYIHVEQGGILGIGAKDLYIPMSVVQDIDPSNCISLSITKQQADDSYQTKPDFLDNGHS